ncbi:unnamed protein product [Camellia sinensis]
MEHNQNMLKPPLFQSNRTWKVLCLIRLSIFFFFFFPVAHAFDNLTNESLDHLLHDLASQTLIQHRPRTGALYRANLPANLSGIQVSVVRLRSKTLWGKGANFSHFQIPLHTIPVPYVKRIVIIYQDFGNWSSHYFNLPGYSLVSSVIGFVAFDASNVSSNSIAKINLDTMGKLIKIQFPNLTFPEERCAIFSPNGTGIVSDVSARGNFCYSGNQGYFSMVTPLMGKKEGMWGLWVGGFVLGVVGFAVVAGFVGVVLVRFMKVKKVQEMERQADEGVGLETVSIGESKMPSAGVMRTHPVLENASLS